MRRFPCRIILVDDSRLLRDTLRLRLQLEEGLEFEAFVDEVERLTS